MSLILPTELKKLNQCLFNVSLTAIPSRLILNFFFLLFIFLDINLLFVLCKMILMFAVMLSRISGLLCNVRAMTIIIGRAI